MKTSALILLDFINDIVHKEGKLASSRGYAKFVEEYDVLTHVNTAIDGARKNNIPIIFVCIGFSPDYKEAPKDSPLFSAIQKFGALQLGTWATEVDKTINKQDSDYLITKHRIGAFRGTYLDMILRMLNVDTLLIGGVATGVTVESTARDALDRDYEVVVLKDLCGAGNIQDQEDALKSLSKIVRVAESSEVEDLL